MRFAPSRERTVASSAQFGAPSSLEYARVHTGPSSATSAARGARPPSAEPCIELVIHPFEPVGNVLGENPAVHEQCVADLREKRATGEKSRVRPARREGSGSAFRFRRQLPGNSCRTGRSEQREGCQTSGGHVPEVERCIHDLVVPEQRENLASGRCRLCLQSVRQIEDPSVVVPAVDLVSRLNNHQVATDPSIVVVDGTRQSQGSARMVEVAVQIADRHQSFRGRPRMLRREVRHGRSRVLRFCRCRLRLGLWNAGATTGGERREDGGAGKRRATPQPKMTRDLQLVCAEAREVAIIKYGLRVAQHLLRGAGDGRPRLCVMAR
jgi:hypothetical protein